MAVNPKYYATGRRKTAVAKVWLTLGSGKIVVNGRDFRDYFPLPVWQILLQRPLALTGSEARFDVEARFQEEDCWSSRGSGSRMPVLWPW